jgi:hypothetical protein
MKLFVSRHAIERMELRQITLEQIEEALSNPDTIRPGHVGSTVVQKVLASGEELKVVVRGRYLVGAKAIIITVAWRGR